MPMSCLKPFKSCFLTVFLFGIFISCTMDDVIKPDIQNIVEEIEEIEEEYSIKTYSFDAQNADIMFQDTESQEVMTSVERRYAISKVLSLKAINEFSFEIANYSPVDIENATVLATIDGIDKQFALCAVTKISAFAKTVVRYSFLDEATQFRATDDSFIELKEFEESGIAIDKISFDFTGEDEYIKSLKKLSSLKWELQYHDYDPDDREDNNWEENLVPLDVRRYAGMIINYGFMIASDEFHEGFLAEKILDNDGETLLTEAQKEEVYQRILDKEFLQMGKVVNVSGLGGGNVLGVAEHVLRDYLINNQFSVVSHEFGHIVGYSHDSGMTYPKIVDGDGVYHGIDPLTKRINEALIMENRYPVTKENYFDNSDLEE